MLIPSYLRILTKNLFRSNGTINFHVVFRHSLVPQLTNDARYRLHSKFISSPTHITHLSRLVTHRFDSRGVRKDEINECVVRHVRIRRSDEFWYIYVFRDHGMYCVVCLFSCVFTALSTMKIIPVSLTVKRMVDATHILGDISNRITLRNRPP